MDLTQTILNIVFPPVVIFMLVCALPPFLVFKFVSHVIRSIFCENVAGKVVLITGASSGIGEFLAYEYGKRGACLVLAARREDRLRKVADKARHLGSPDVMVVRADVSNVEDSKRLVNEAVKHFGRLNHLVINAGIVEASMFEDPSTLSDMIVPIMDVNFWGSVYTTHFAVPHLKRSKGKIVVIASLAGWFTAPRMSIYNASKAAIMNLYETLRIEFGSDIGITIVTPGLIESEMCYDGNLQKVNMTFIPVASTEGCATGIVDSACRGDRYLTQPFWVKAGFLWKVLCPDILEWCIRYVLLIRPGPLETDVTTSNINEPQKFHNSSAIQSSELKAD